MNMRPVIYDLTLHAYEHIGGTVVTVTVHDPQVRTLSSSPILKQTVHLEVSEGELDAESWVRDVLVAAAEML